VTLIYPFADFADLALVTAPAAELSPTLTPTDAVSNFDGLLTLQLQSALTSSYSTGFSVSFTKLTTKAFDPQTFQIVDGDTFAVIDTGSVTIGSPSPVPEPSKAALLLLGAFAIAGAQWRRSRAV